MFSLLRSSSSAPPLPCPPSRSTTLEWKSRGGFRWIGSVDLASVPANETTLGGGSRALFNSATMLDQSFGGTATVGVRLSQLIRVEGAVVFSPTQLSTRITEDAEGVPDTTITSPVTQILVEGGVLAQPRRWRTRHVSPFVVAGLGYLRQLNDGRTLVETGSSYYVGGGLYYVRTAARPGRVKATGVRADVRALVLHDGVAPDSDWRTHRRDYGYFLHAVLDQSWLQNRA